MMQEQDSEPLFGPDVYNLLRDDSLLTRTGSNNFATLLEPQQDAPIAQEQQQQQPQLQPQQQQQQQQATHIFAQGVGQQVIYCENLNQMPEGEASRQNIPAEDGQVLGLTWGDMEANEPDPVVRNDAFSLC